MPQVTVVMHVMVKTFIMKLSNHGMVGHLFRSALRNSNVVKFQLLDSNSILILVVRAMGCWANKVLLIRMLNN